MKTLYVCLMRRIGFVLVLAAAAMRPAAAVSNGVQVLQGLTVPAGGAWIPGALGGHFWQPDTATGICRVNGTGTGNCNGTAKSGGQIAVGTAPNGTIYVFVPDTSAKSTNVVRYVFNPANETLNNPLIMNIPNVTSVGGGAGGGRPGSAVLDSLGNLYVGYLKSGDIMKVAAAMTTTSSAPPAARVATTSDGRGVNALLFFGVDLYLAETGGMGVSRISDPNGTARAACSAAALCTAAPLNPQISFFPGALATDNVYIYVGDAPITTPGSVLQYDPTLPTGAGNPASYSVNVPAYKSAFDGVTRNQYVGIRGLAVDPSGNLYVADDPTTNLVLPVLPTGQGHLWKVPFPGTPLTVRTYTPNTGPGSGNTNITITGTGFSLTPGVMSAFFGPTPAASITCSTTTTCTIVTPAVPGGGVVPLIVNAGAQTVTAGSFSFTPAGVTGTPPTITGISPNLGLIAGGSRVVVTGTNLLGAAATTVTFGLAGPGTVVPGSCTATQCTVVSPAFTGPAVVDIQLSVDGQLTPATTADRFTYGSATATLFAWGITAPKGGMLFIPGNLGGHFWSSDHAQGFCRHDPLTARAASWGTPASAGSATLRAMNWSVCDDGTIGSPGQAVYDPRINGPLVNTTSGRSVPAGTHYIYVPDNAVKSTAVWRLTFDPNTETIIDSPEAMIPLANVRTLKPNGMALGPDGNLYITDLTEMNIRKLVGPNGDPRLQTLDIVAVTGDGRGANGSIGFIGNNLYISENRAAAYFDITLCPVVNPVTLVRTPCATTAIPLPSGAFVAGVATDPVHNYVYAADSPGGANATIWRYDLNNPAAPAIPYLTGGKLPAAGTPEATVWISQTGVGPWNPLYTPGGTAGFSFAFGIWVDARNGDLYITGDPVAGARSGLGTAWVAKLIQ
jgi:hypothetical protein